MGWAKDNNNGGYKQFLGLGNTEFGQWVDRTLSKNKAQQQATQNSNDFATAMNSQTQQNSCSVDSPNNPANQTVATSPVATTSCGGDILSGAGITASSATIPSQFNLNPLNFAINPIDTSTNTSTSVNSSTQSGPGASNAPVQATKSSSNYIIIGGVVAIVVIVGGIFIYRKIKMKK